MSRAGFEPSPVTPRHVNQRFRPLGHTGQISNGVFIVLQYPDLWIQMELWQCMNEIGYGLIANVFSSVNSCYTS